MKDSKDKQALFILENIEKNPDTTQADLAAQLGIAVGSVNWYLKRMIKKGYVKVTQMQRRRLRYLLTPKGIAEKARLTTEFMQASLYWYRITRETTTSFLQEIKQAGYTEVYIAGDSDLAEIVYLSCLEAQVKVKTVNDSTCPVFRIEGLKTVLDWPDDDSQTDS